MGHTKTICCNTRPNVDELRLEWSRIRSARQALMVRLEQYLAEEACVPGAPKNARGADAYLDLVGDAYLALLKEELAGHGDDVGSIRSMKAIGAICMELIRFPTQFGNEHFEREDHLSIEPNSGPGCDAGRLQRLVEFHAKTTIEGEIENEALKFGALLIGSFTKAFAESHAALNSGDANVVKHHLTLMGDIVEELVRLPLYAVPREYTDHTEFSLPSGHPHSMPA